MRTSRCPTDTERFRCPHWLRCYRQGTRLDHIPVGIVQYVCERDMLKEAVCTTGSIWYVGERLLGGECKGGGGRRKHKNGRNEKERV